MVLYRDGVEVLCCPDSAKCCCDDVAIPLDDLVDCPLGCEYCDGDCDYYTED